ncbi:MAG: hypothetical protein RLZZ244_1463 [Verrucomicrobiota bacterium]
MQFWILLGGCLGILGAQWALITLIALGALRRKAGAALGQIGGPIGRWLEEARQLAELARGSGISEGEVAPFLAACRELRAAADAAGERVWETEWVARLRAAWEQGGRELGVLEERVAASALLVEGWIPSLVAVRECEASVWRTVGVYGGEVEAYARRRSAWGAGILAGVFGYGPLVDWQPGVRPARV